MGLLVRTLAGFEKVGASSLIDADLLLIANLLEQFGDRIPVFDDLCVRTERPRRHCHR